MFWMEHVPFEPGESPFHCKGILYLDTLAFFDERVPGGRDALFADIGEPKLRAFFGQHFVVGGWYDVFPLLALQSVAASALAMPYLEVIRAVARAQVPNQFRGVYKFLLKLSSPDMVMNSLPRLSAKYYDFVKSEVRQVRAKLYESSGEGVPLVAASAYMISTDVGIREALELAGAQGVRLHWLPVEPMGEAHGIPIVRTRREATWS